MDSKEKTLKNAAIIIGDWHFNSLGLIRSLGEQGIPCYFINMSNGGYGEDSKYTIKTIRAFDEKAVIDAICSIADTQSLPSLLFPSSDLAALYIDRNRALLEENCICPGAKGNIEHIMDKSVMCEAAKNAGFNIPKGKTVELDERKRIYKKLFAAVFD